MSDTRWETTGPRRGHRRWLVVGLVAPAVVVAGVVARTESDGPRTGSDDPGALVVETETPDAVTVDAQPPAPVDGDWTQLDDPPVGVPRRHLGLWTGAELLVGFQPELAAYDPETAAWRALPSLPGAARVEPSVAWTGSEVLVFGGAEPDGEAAHADGYRLDPDQRGGWEPIPPAPSPPLYGGVAVWTGSELVVWGGARPEQAPERGEWPVNGSAFDPAAGRWRSLPPAPVRGVLFTSGLWTGREMLVWGTHHPTGTEQDPRAGLPFAAAYDPAADAWRRLPAPPLHDPTSAAGVWTGRELLLWGGEPSWSEDAAEVGGAAFDPRAPGAAWRMLPDPGLEPNPMTAMYGFTGAWTGEQAFFYGGYPVSVGLLYDPAERTWAELPSHRGRVNAVAAWTGAELLLWGGYTPTGPDIDLWSFRAGSAPAQDSAPAAASVPTDRSS